MGDLQAEPLVAEPEVACRPPLSPRVVVVMPAFNAARTLEATCARIPAGVAHAIILVDDASEDATVEIAERLNLITIRHRKNCGYGRSQKTCYQKALELEADIVVMLHPDYQYDPKILPDLIAPIANGAADVVLASRFLGAPLAGGMPLYKFVGNRVLTWLENRALGQTLSEYHTGYRAFSSTALRSISFAGNSESFVFDNELLAQFVLARLRIAEVPVRTRYAEDSSTIGFGTSLRYGMGCLRVMTESVLQRSGLVAFERYTAPSSRIVTHKQA